MAHRNRSISIRIALVALLFCRRRREPVARGHRLREFEHHGQRTVDCGQRVHPDRGDLRDRRRHADHRAGHRDPRRARVGARRQRSRRAGRHPRIEILALGTRLKPIVFTDLDDDNVGGNPGTSPTTAATTRWAHRTWGGVILLGRGYVANDTLGGPDATREVQIEGLIAAGGLGLYGNCAGDADQPADCDDDDSGEMLLRLDPLRRLQPLGRQRDQRPDAGRGRTRDRPRPHRDLPEQGRRRRVLRRRGNMQEPRSSRNVGDDSIDYDEGWRGKVQFVFVMQGTARHRQVGQGRPSRTAATTPTAAALRDSDDLQRDLHRPGRRRRLHRQITNTALDLPRQRGRPLLQQLLRRLRRRACHRGRRLLRRHGDAEHVGRAGEHGLRRRQRQFSGPGLDLPAGAAGQRVLVHRQRRRDPGPADASAVGGSSSKLHYDNDGFGANGPQRLLRLRRPAADPGADPHGDAVPTVPDAVDRDRSAAGRRQRAADGTTARPRRRRLLRARRPTGAPSVPTTTGPRAGRRPPPGYFPAKPTGHRRRRHHRRARPGPRTTSTILDQPIYVTNGATLTIEPGTVDPRPGRVGPGANDPGALVIARGSKLIAVGTAGQADRLHQPGRRQRRRQPGQLPLRHAATNALAFTGNWGGLIMLGRGYVANNTLGGADATREVQIEGLIAAGGLGLYGNCAADPLSPPDCDDDDSGRPVLRLDPLRRLQPLGRQRDQRPDPGRRRSRDATCDHVEIFQNKDDGVEFFGGTANIRT